MGNVEMSDGDYANVEDFPLINAEQPEPVARRLGVVVVLILLYESGGARFSIYLKLEGTTILPR